MGPDHAGVAGGRGGRAGALAVVLLTLTATPLAIPQPATAGPIAGPGGAARPAPAPAVQPTLEGAATAFARLWARADADGITAELATRGLRLDLGPGREGLVGPRQARAALRDFLEPFETVDLDVQRVHEAGGEPSRGFVELRWTAAVSGTEDAVRYTLFAGFVLEDGVWRLAEVRIFP